MFLNILDEILPLRRAPVCSVLLRYVGGFGGGLGGDTPRRRFRALCGGCGGALGGQSVQYAAAVVGGDGLLRKGLELFLGQRDGVGQQLLDKSHALAEAVRPVLALLSFLLLENPPCAFIGVGAWWGLDGGMRGSGFLRSDFVGFAFLMELNLINIKIKLRVFKEVWEI